MTTTTTTATPARLIVSAIVAAAALVAAPAGAVDGEILINQAGVNAGGITPGDAAGFPATLSRPGRYKLTGNLGVSGGQSAIMVTADDVTIDLNGFTISSDSSGQSGYGIYAAGSMRLRVVKGMIAGFGEATYHNTATGVVIDNMRIISNGQGVSSGKQTTITNSTIANNSGYGILCGFCRIQGNVITGNGTGMFVSDGAGLVLGNVIVGNGGFGILSNAKTGYGNNIIVGNNGGSVNAGLVQLHPNVCDPACP
jgi:hypothetical protein